MSQKVSLLKYAAEEAYISDISLVEKSIQPIFSYLGENSFYNFIDRYANNETIDYIRMFKTKERADLFQESLTAFDALYNQKKVSDDLVKTKIENYTKEAFSYIGSFSLDMSLKEFEEILFFVKKTVSFDYFIKDDDTLEDSNFIKKHYNHMFRLINCEFYNSVVNKIINELKGCIIFNTANNGTTHLIPEFSFQVKRFKRIGFETICPQKKDLFVLNNHLNESFVDCPKCISQLFKIYKNKSNIIRL